MSSTNRQNILIHSSSLDMRYFFILSLCVLWQKGAFSAQIRKKNSDNSLSFERLRRASSPLLVNFDSFGIPRFSGIGRDAGRFGSSTTTESPESVSENPEVTGTARPDENHSYSITVAAQDSAKDRRRKKLRNDTSRKTATSRGDLLRIVADAEPTAPLDIETTVPLGIETTAPLDIETTVPLGIETTVPLGIETTVTLSAAQPVESEWTRTEQSSEKQILSPTTSIPSAGPNQILVTSVFSIEEKSTNSEDTRRNRAELLHERNINVQENNDEKHSLSLVQQRSTTTPQNRSPTTITASKSTLVSSANTVTVRRTTTGRPNATASKQLLAVHDNRQASQNIPTLPLATSAVQFSAAQSPASTPAADQEIQQNNRASQTLHETARFQEPSPAQTGRYEVGGPTCVCPCAKPVTPPVTQIGPPGCDGNCRQQLIQGGPISRPAIYQPPPRLRPYSGLSPVDNYFGPPLFGRGANRNY